MSAIDRATKHILQAREQHHEDRPRRGRAHNSRALVFAKREAHRAQRRLDRVVVAGNDDVGDETDAAHAPFMACDGEHCAQDDDTFDGFCDCDECLGIEPSPDAFTAFLHAARARGWRVAA